MNAPIIDIHPRIETTPTVYAPTDDSFFLIDALRDAGVCAGASVLDLCTGSGVIAIAAARAGASSVTAIDISPAAVDCARANAAANNVVVDVVCGDLSDALVRGPFDVVLCNPPYVPGAMPSADTPQLALAWDAGPEGRVVVDPLCAAARDLLSPRGTLLMVHSVLTNADRSVEQLRAGGLSAAVIDRRIIPFGPVMKDRAEWLEARGFVDVGARMEELVVIRADRR